MASTDEPHALDAPICPLYFVIDTSTSMTGTDVDGETSERTNRLVRAVISEVAHAPDLADRVRIGIITFSGSPTTVVPLCDPRRITTLPAAFESDGGSAFAPLFRHLRDRIVADVALLRAGGPQVARPVVFVVSDGEATDRRREWLPELERLRDPLLPERPIFVAVRSTGSRRSILDEVVTTDPTSGTIDLATVDMSDGELIRYTARRIVGSVVQTVRPLGIDVAPKGW